MEKGGTRIKRHTSYNLIIVVLGISGMILACMYDIIRNRPVEFGLEQAAAFVISAIIALTGFHRLPFLRVNQWYGLLLATYFAGVLFMGLKIRGHHHHRADGPLQDTSVFLGDVAMNFLGFVPLGYLVAIYLLATIFIRKARLQFFFAVFLCAGTSLFIELAQFYLSGRTSSLIDFLSNGAGALFGVALGFLAHKILLTERVN